MDFNPSLQLESNTKPDTSENNHWDRKDCTDIRNHDVLCGRQRHCHEHAGNKRFRAMVQHYRQQYQSSNRRDEKSILTRAIIDDIRRKGGRFLKYNPTHRTFVPLDEANTYEKVSHALRSARDSSSTKEKRKEDRGHQLKALEREGSKFHAMLSTQQKIFEDLQRQANCEPPNLLRSHSVPSPQQAPRTAEATRSQSIDTKPNLATPTDETCLYDIFSSTLLNHDDEQCDYAKLPPPRR